MQISHQGEHPEMGPTPGEPRNATRKRRNYSGLAPAVFLPAGTTIADAIAAEHQRAFIVGPVPNARQAAAQTPEGVALYLAGHSPSATLRRPGSSAIRVAYAASWFGPGDYTAADAAAVWERLQAAIRNAWHDDTAALMMTPATTGRDLWERTVPAAGWPVIPAAWQDWIRSHSGQGRVETFPGPAGLTAGAIHQYDARIAYTALTRNLPLGIPEEVTRSDYDLRRPGRYLVEWHAPRDWGTRPGILAEPLGRDERRRWHWPTDGRGIVDAVELRLADIYGWSYTVERAWVWERSGDPMRTWTDRLHKIHGAAIPTDGVRGDMWRYAVRAIMLHAIGAMHGTPHRVSATGDAEAVPEDAQDLRSLGGGRFTWYTSEAAAWPDTIHPEWTSTVWARARARLLDAPTADGRRWGLLHMPAGKAIAARTDAIYTDGPADVGPDDGRPGRYRLKGVWPRQPRPREMSDVLALREP